MLVDGIIVAMTALLAYHGQRIGLVRQLLSAAGFVGGLFVGSALQPYLLGEASDDPNQAILALALSLASALFFLSMGEFSGALLKRKLREVMHLDKVDVVAGSVAGGVSLLLSVWLLTPSLLHVPSPGLNKALEGSRIVSVLGSRLPPAPEFIAGLNRLINPNGFPDVFAGFDRQPLDDGTPLPDLGSGELQAAVQNARASVVKLEGRGCGGLVDGSGYVAAKNGDLSIVVTNAHVVAGVERPTVLDANGRHTAVPVWFNSDLDIAILQVRGLAGKPLQSGPTNASRGTPTAVLGYPGGGSFRAGGATVLDQFTAIGKDIYGQQRTRRNIYELKANIIPGNSGGPVINSQGQVVGVVFAQSTSYQQIGYALSMSAVNADLKQAVASRTAVSTGECTQ